MKIDNFNKIGVIFILIGLCIKIPSLYFDVVYLFNIGFGFGGIAVIFLIISLVKNRKKN